jgi:hypothetical protein
LLQPLNVVLFSLLAHFYLLAVTQHLHDSQALAGVAKANFFMLFYRLWQRIMTGVRILSSFEATGIWPLNVTRKMNTNQPTNQPLNVSVILSRWDNDSDDGYETPPAIEADHWRAIDRLYKAVVGEDMLEDARQLCRTLHHLSAYCKLLDAEVEGLCAVIATLKSVKEDA